MSFFDTLQEATQQERQTLFNLPIIRDALDGQVSLASYRGFLIQAYYHVRHTVPLMMACGARLPTRLEWLRKAVCEYIEDEYGHEQWVLKRGCDGLLMLLGRLLSSVVVLKPICGQIWQSVIQGLQEGPCFL